MHRDAFDTVMASLDAPMAVVTAATGAATGAAADGERAGCLVGFHAQCSIDPPQHAVWLSKANHTYRVALLADHLGVHLLTDSDADRDLAELFGTLSGDDTDKFAGLDVESGPGGVPVLVGCPHRLVVRRVAVVDVGGDHVCFVTEPVAATSSGRFRPLRLGAVTDLDPGHEAEERPRPRTERAGPR
jgi:flavin reductase (DIM6/NTAB) family NADH-FMN oxidoreductase RutF